jgi:ubiquitin-conjugating enzyme E2 J1
MDTDAKGQLGGMNCDAPTRKHMAKNSPDFVCSACGKSNKSIMDEREEAFKAMGSSAGKAKEEVVPEELRLAYREDLGEAPTPAAAASTASTATAIQQPHRPVARIAQQRAGSDDGWIDKAIYAVAGLLVFLVLKRFLMLF